jgi:glycerol-3-phosphate dehydrogenase subunit C
MREGSLDAPVRHPLNWQDPEFTDMDKIMPEMDRVFDICHGCRRCFNLCDSFPILFDLIDEAPSGELDTVDKADYKKVVDACTLCDMCFMVSCPYVPPHEFDLDFPHLMLRYRAAEQRQGKGEPGLADQMTKTDRNGKLGAILPALANWAMKVDNAMTRPLMERLAHVHREAWLPKFHSDTFEDRARGETPELNAEAPAKGRKAVLYATCFVNFNEPGTGSAARHVLAKNGVETEVVYPECCGMPQLEQGKIEDVAGKAKRIAGEMKGWIEQGYDVIALTPSCALMLKFEWPLMLPDDEDVKRLSHATFDITEYVVDIANKEGLAEGLGPLDGGVALHIACHARAQNMGMKARDMMKLIPEADIKMLPRCSGHGGSWGVRVEHFDQAMKVGKPAMRDALKAEKKYVSSECPLAGLHIQQGMAKLAADNAEGPQPTSEKARHPIELFARAYGFELDR